MLGAHRRYLLLTLTLLSLVKGDVIFHDDFTLTPSASGKWSWDAERFGTEGGWMASQTTSALLMAGRHVWVGYHGRSFKASDHGGKLTLEATWSPGTTSYIDEDFWIGFCSVAPSSQSPERSTNNLNLPYTQCVAGQLYDTAASVVTSYITVPAVGETHGAKQCKYADAAVDQSSTTRKGHVRQWLTVDTATSIATFENDLGCDTVTKSVVQSGQSLADNELWVYVGVDADFMPWLEVESVSVKDASGQVIWRTKFEDRTATLESWFSHVMYSQGCPSIMAMGSIVNVPDGYLEVTGPSTALQADVTITGDGGEGTYITLEAMPDHLAPVLVDNDIAILICNTTGQYTWTKNSTDNCMKFMMLQSNSHFKKRLAMPGDKVLGENYGFTCATDHFLRLRAIISRDKVFFGDSAGCPLMSFDNPWTSADTLHVYLAWDEQSTYYTTVLDFKIETGGVPSGALLDRTSWIFEQVKCPEELHWFMWFQTAVCVPADRLIDSVGPGIADGDCHWGERVTYEDAGPLTGQDLYYQTVCASDGSGLAFFKLFVDGNCTGEPLMEMDEVGLDTCAAGNIAGVDFSVKVIGACPSTPFYGIASVSIHGTMELTVNAENYDGVGDFATNANVISAVRQALARRTAVRVEHVEVSIIQERRLFSLEITERRLQQSTVTMAYTITRYGATAEADANAAQALLLLDTSALLVLLDEFLDDAYLGKQVVTDVSIHPESTTNIVAPGNADDGSVKTGRRHNRWIGESFVVLVILCVLGTCAAGIICFMRHRDLEGRTRLKHQRWSEPNSELTSVLPFDGVVVVGRPVDETSPDDIVVGIADEASQESDVDGKP